VHVAEAAFIAAAGFVGGGVNAVAGGGSLIVFPALVATGFGTLPATVTNSVGMWPGYAGGVAGYRPELAGQRGRVRRLAAVAVGGSAVGSALLLVTPGEAFDLIVPFLVLLASLLLAAQPRISRLVGEPSPHAPHGGPALYLGVALASVYGGYFFGALGVILLGTLALTLHDTLRRLNALKSTLSLVIATVAVVAFGLFGPVDWAAAGIVAPASLAGGLVGARLARRLDDRPLRWCVVAFGVTVAAILLVRAL
jgi:uncharacterized protein